MCFFHFWILDKDVHRHSDGQGVFFKEDIPNQLTSYCVLNDKEQGEFPAIHFYKGPNPVYKSLTLSIHFIRPHLLMSLYYELSV